MEECRSAPGVVIVFDMRLASRNEKARLERRAGHLYPLD
jgi:hypothetical protein